MPRDDMCAAGDSQACHAERVDRLFPVTARNQRSISLPKSLLAVSHAAGGATAHENVPQVANLRYSLFPGQFLMPRAAPRRMKMYRKPPACRVAQGERNPPDCGTALFPGQRPDFDKFATWRRPDAAVGEIDGWWRLRYNRRAFEIIELYPRADRRADAFREEK